MYYDTSMYYERLINNFIYEHIELVSIMPMMVIGVVFITLALTGELDNEL